MQLMHKDQVERLKRRLVDARQQEEALHSELDDNIKGREKKEDEIWQNQREEKKLGKEFDTVMNARYKFPFNFLTYQTKNWKCQKKTGIRYRQFSEH